MIFNEKSPRRHFRGLFEFFLVEHASRSPGAKLPLAELHTTACATQAVLLPFLHAGVAREEAVAAEVGEGGGVIVAQSAGNPHLDRAGLASWSAATNADVHVHVAAVARAFECV